jgi:hypothetical protein
MVQVDQPKPRISGPNDVPHVTPQFFAEDSLATQCVERRFRRERQPAKLRRSQ